MSKGLRAILKKIVEDPTNQLLADRYLVLIADMEDVSKIDALLDLAHVYLHINSEQALKIATEIGPSHSETAQKRAKKIIDIIENKYQDIRQSHNQQPNQKPNQSDQQENQAEFREVEDIEHSIVSVNANTELIMDEDIEVTKSKAAIYQPQIFDENVDHSQINETEDLSSNPTDLELRDVPSVIDIPVAEVLSRQENHINESPTNKNDFNSDVELNDPGSQFQIELSNLNSIKSVVDSDISPENSVISESFEDKNAKSSLASIVEITNSQDLEEVVAHEPSEVLNKTDENLDNNSDNSYNNIAVAALETKENNLTDDNTDAIKTENTSEDTASDINPKNISLLITPKEAHFDLLLLKLDSQNFNSEELLSLIQQLWGAFVDENSQKLLLRLNMQHSSPELWAVYLQTLMLSGKFHKALYEIYTFIQTKEELSWFKIAWRYLPLCWNKLGMVGFSWEEGLGIQVFKKSCQRRPVPKASYQVA